MMLATICSLVCSAALTPAACPQAPPSPSPVDAVCARFRDFDHDRDGQVEIAQVTPMHTNGSTGPFALVLVEARLADAADGQQDLTPRIARLVDDLAAEGHRAVALRVALQPSPRHQDGRYVLALRELLRAFAGLDDGLRAAVLLGHFPDALLVRTCNWRRHGKVKLGGKGDRRDYADAFYLRRIPEDVAHRADIVLADLDGRWQDVYVQPPTAVPAVQAVFAARIPAAGGPCLDVHESSRTYADFFLLDDGACELLPQLGPADAAPWFATLDDRAGGRECSDADRLRPNVIARPDVRIGRIDAHGTAMVPRADLVGSDGRHLLDQNGRPQPVAFASRKDVPDWRRLWRHDEALERRLLADYLDRNHDHRTGRSAIAWRPSSLACDLRSGYREMLKAADDWSRAPAAQADVHGKPGLGAVADWLALPAVLRTLRAHSDPWGSVFRKRKVETFADRLGGTPWSWSRSGARLVPSLRAACSNGKLDWHLLHTLWQNGAVADEPCFYHHTGCHGISPPNALRRPYDAPGYGRMQGAEALLLFGNGLALVGRAKVFYDEPRGFAETLRDGGTFGDAWARYYEVESAATTWRKAGGDIGRKRSYFWSVLGDPTLRLRHPDRTASRR